MIALSAKDITKSLGGETIIKNISFHINKGDKMGIVGVNGAGKTTLLNILGGVTNADEGEFFVTKGTKIGYLKQRENFPEEKTVIQAISGVSGYDYESEVTAMLKAMSFEEETYNLPIKTLSGGEQSRLALACLLLSKPDILLLDEPTNHLDLGTIQWLEQYLKAYKGSLIVVSHDRYFLDKTVNKIMEISNSSARVYQGNYSDYAIKRKAIRESEERAFNKQQEEIKRQEEMIRRFKERGTEKLAKRAASKEKRLEKTEVLHRPEREAGRMGISFKEEFPSGKDVLEGENLSMKFKGVLFSNLDFSIRRGERVAILGANGAGKTTLLKIITGRLAPTEGRIKIGHNVSFGYYDQGQQLFNPINTVMEEVHGAFRLYKETEIRKLLGRFLFKGDDVFLQVGSLSGGEKARLALLKLMMGGYNVLVLDEPTNHLDIQSKEAFEEALLDYPGTLIVVSHDRYFINKVPKKFIDLANYQKDSSFEKGTSGEKEDKNSLDSSGNQGEEISDSAVQRMKNKQIQAEQRRKAREKKRLESLIEKFEKDIESNEEEMCLKENLSNFDKLEKIHKETKKLKAQLEETYEKWLELS